LYVAGDACVEIKGEIQTAAAVEQIVIARPVGAEDQIPVPLDNQTGTPYTKSKIRLFQVFHYL